MILLTVLMDFTDAATAALAYAQVLARHLLDRKIPAELCLLAVAPTAADPAAPHFARTAGLEPYRVATKLRKRAEQLSAAGVPCRYDLVLDPVAQELPLRLHALHTTALVLGRADNATAFYLVNLLTVPLLLVPEHMQPPVAAPKRIVLDTDCQPVRLPQQAQGATELVLSLLDEGRVPYLGPGRRAAGRLLSQLLQPSAVGIHVYTAHEPPPPPKQLRRRLNEIGFLAGLPHAVQTTYHPSIADGIMQMTLAHAAELLVFVARQRSLPPEQFIDSPPAQLMRSCPLPMLVVPEAEPVTWTRFV